MPIIGTTGGGHEVPSCLDRVYDGIYRRDPDRWVNVGETAKETRRRFPGWELQDHEDAANLHHYGEEGGGEITQWDEDEGGIRARKLAAADCHRMARWR